MKNKKGFTLIELVAILGIISIIILLGAPILINQIETSRKNKYNNFVSDLCLAAESYINHSNDIEEFDDFNNPNDTVNINISSLIANGYIKSNIKNPNTDEKINDEILTVKLTDDMTYSCTLGG